VIVRQAPIGEDLERLFQKKGIKIKDVELEVTTCFNIVNRALADLMIKLRIPMGSQDGSLPTTSATFRSAHLWLLSDFFHNVLPTLSGAWLDVAIEKGWEAIWLEASETPVLTGGSDRFSNALATAYFLSPEWIAEDSAMRKEQGEPSLLVESFLGRLENQLSRSQLSKDVAAKELTNGNRPLGTSVFANEDVKLRHLKLYFLSFNWLRLYNLIMAVGFRIHNLYRSTEDVDPSSIDDATTAQLLVLAGRFHGKLNVSSPDKAARAGLYGRHEAVLQFIASIADV
jgi:hypothetical protein